MSLTRILMLLIYGSLTGCGQIGYFAQAAKGQFQIIANKQDIQTVIDNPDTEESLQQRLQLAQDIRQFAVDHLALPDNRSYRTYSATGRDYAVWNVVAAPKFSMALYTWCFPLTGCLAYKGYFSKNDAIKLNEEMIAQGFDTYLYGVSAYSTLGWFSDPILDTFLDYREESLADLIFHELAHQVVYIKDDSSFNEAFATAVGQTGMAAWMKHRYPDQNRQSSLSKHNRHGKITDMVLQFRQKLALAYTENTESELAEIKKSLFEEMKQVYAEIQNKGEGTRFYDWWFSLDLNNAHLSSIATYNRLVPAFEKVLEKSASYEEFYETVEVHAKLGKPERDAWLSSFE